MLGIDIHDVMAVLVLSALALLLIPLYFIATIGNLVSHIVIDLKNILSSFIVDVIIWKSDAGIIRVERATEVDALKALVRALSFQQKKIAKLEALCKGIRDDKYDAKSLKRKVFSLEEEKTELQLQLDVSKETNACLQSKLNELEAEVLNKAHQVIRLEDPLDLNRIADTEEDKVFSDQVSASSDGEVPKCDPASLYDQQFDIEKRSEELEELRDECTRLRAEIVAMSASHERTERLNKSKINILIEMKAALEAQVKLLESK